MEFLQTATCINSAWVGSAFLFGFGCKRLNLPPMLGFLLAGFAMNFLGLTGGSLALDRIADMGIIVLLFTIGLKLDLKGLSKPEIWGGATVHALLTIFLLAMAILLASTLGVAHLAGLSLEQATLIGFALSFSSTVFAVKVLEEKGEMNALHGRAAIGILIMQDLMAVFFLTVSKGEFPSLWVLGLPLLLLAIRPLLMRIIDHIGHVLVALGLAALLPAKTFIYFLVLTRFRLRARTSLLASLNLANYSEFGLLVTAIAMKQGWLGPDWLITVALALSFSFLLAAPLNSKANRLYDFFAVQLQRFETKTRHPGDISLDLGQADTLIFGMGPFGTMAYDTIQERMGDKVLAVDYNRETVRHHSAAGRKVIWGDATDYDFWRKIDLGQVKIIMLTMSNHQANLLTLREIHSAGFQGPVTATARFEDQRLELEEAGATAAYNIFSEAGAGYANHVCRATGLVCKTQFFVPDTTIPSMPGRG